MVVDEALVATGSYNWTRSAERHNQENILVSDEPKLVASYLSAFNELWNRFD
jgi:phosphatidylserine/phosphatidylglycerophosphate/cardiolipin synthase-like enzyme